MDRLIKAEENARRQIAESARLAEQKVLKDAKRAEKWKVEQEKFHQAMMEENKEVAKELMFTGMKLRSAIERVRMLQWMNKLSDSSTRRDVLISNQYLNYLRATLQGEYQVLTKPFDTPPPEILVSLGECLANKVADAIPDVPRAGPLQPVLCHKSDDDRAFMYVKQTADKGLLVYMACAPDSNAMKHP